jgi:hypothetical protein
MAAPPASDRRTRGKGRQLELGPVELLIVGFPGNKFNGDVAPALMELVENGTIRIIDLLFVGKDDEGNVEAFEVSGLDDDLAAKFMPLLHDNASGLIGEEDVEDVAEALEPNSSAALLLYEQLWAIRFRDALAGSGAELMDLFRIPGEVIDEALAEQG